MAGCKKGVKCWKFFTDNYGLLIYHLWSNLEIGERRVKRGNNKGQ
jgi:hypothetical protein